MNPSRDLCNRAEERVDISRHYYPFLYILQADSY